MFELDGAGRCHCFQAPRIEFLAAPPDQIIGRTMAELLPTEAAEVVMAALGEAGDKGSSVGGQYALDLVSGRFWFELSVARKHGSPEFPPRYIVLCRDITERKMAEAKAGAREKQFQALAENAPDTISRYDTEGRVLYANTRLQSALGLNIHDHLGKTPRETFPAGQYDEYQTRLMGVVRTGNPCEIEMAVAAPGGVIRYNQVRFVAERDSQGKIEGVLSIGRDVTELRESQRRLEHAEAMAHIGHWQWDYLRKESFVSAEVRRIFRQSSSWQPTLDEVLLFLCEEDREAVRSLFHETYVNRLSELAFGYRIINGEKETRHLHTHVQISYSVDNLPIRLVGTIQDVTKITAYEQDLHNLSFFDPLTTLPNRVLFNDRIRQAVAEAGRHLQSVGLLLLDLDRFKSVNDTFGHGIGDQILIEASARLKTLVNDYVTVARLSGDEFAIVLSDVRDAFDLGVVARKILEAFRCPFPVGEREVFISACVGIAVYPADAHSIEALFQYADSALHHAKEHGRSQYRFYSSELTAQSRNRIILEAALRLAVPQGQMELFYQPQVDLSLGKVVGAEALVRWHHPEQGLLSPDQFIPAAEETGLIVEIGEWVLDTAFQQARIWNEGRSTPFRVAVNLSTRQFLSGGFEKRVADLAARAGCRPEWIELEITESLLLKDSDAILKTLESLSLQGFTIAIDDFGTGYSALSYLNRFPIDTLKIDRSFITGIADRPDSAELVKAILSMAEALKLAVVAEGIERESEESFLQAHICQFGQGFRYGRPLPVTEFEKNFKTSG
jgi:diguanylate cyclase (GGDEF)-like protein/PAS domain S-box-containing protein